MAEPKREVCSIRIMFPVESDEQAIDYKKKISDILGGIPDAQIQFSIMSLPVNARRPDGLGL